MTFSSSSSSPSSSPPLPSSLPHSSLSSTPLRVENSEKNENGNGNGIGDGGDGSLSLKEMTAEEIENEIKVPEIEDEKEEASEFTFQSTSVVIAVFVQQFIILGNLYSFGVYQSEYEIEFPDTSPAAIAFIGSLQASLVLGLGILAGYLAEIIGRRSLVFIGTFLFALSNILASMTDEIVYLYLTQGVLQGIAMSLAFIASTTSVPSWFEKRRGVASGIAVSGSGLGGFVFSPVIAILFSYFSRAGVLRVMALINFTAQILTAPFIMTKQDYEKKKSKKEENEKIEPPNPPQKMTFWEAATDPIFVLFTAGSVVLGTGYLVPFFFLPRFAIVNGMSLSYGAFVLGVVNLGSGIGRVCWGILGDRFGFLEMNTFAMALTSVLIYIWIFCTTKFTLFCFSLSFGFCVGGFISLCPAIVAHVWGVGALGTLFGTIYTFSAIGNFIGPIIFGKMIDHYDPSFWETQVVCGLFFIGSAVLFFLSTYLFRRRAEVIS
mmetsp:Transcript_7630/g.10247  ORF Transcript_7630/g.10247 Transcript_7630/m.10247 type:complete len:491 (+) Transcript_7630:703-2175(+)